MGTTLLHPTLMTQAVTPPVWSGPGGELECSPPQRPHGKPGLSLLAGSAPHSLKSQDFQPTQQWQECSAPTRITGGHRVMRHPGPPNHVATWGAGTPILAPTHPSV